MAGLRTSGIKPDCVLNCHKVASLGCCAIIAPFPDVCFCGYDILFPHLYSIAISLDKSRVTRYHTSNDKNVKILFLLIRSEGIMADYDFTSAERELGRVVFSLTLDKKGLEERIVIGKAEETRRRLDGGADCDVYYDETRPLGSLLLTFEADKGREWNKNGMVLRESYGKVIPFESDRWEMAAPVSAFLSKKYESGEPSAVFAAIRTWEEYLNCFNMNHGADILTERLSMLHKPFYIYSRYKPWQSEAADALRNALRDGESSVELWYPVARRRLETVATSSSFLPLIFYYLNKVAEWRFVFQECKVCGKYFLARSRHYELCSDDCRKAQSTTAKREFDERTKGDRLEQLDKAAYYYWHNRLRKLRKTAEPEKVAAFKTAFDAFRKEAVRRKAAVRRGEVKLNDFTA